MIGEPESYPRFVRGLSWCERLTDQAYTVPLFTYALNYAYNSQLEFTPVPDETPRFYEARWAE